MTKGIRSIKRGIAVLLSACMVFSMTPIQARAEEAGTSVSGNETQIQAESSGSGSETQTQEEPSESGSDAQTQAKPSGSGSETQMQAEPSGAGSDAQTEGSASGNESSGVYELTEKNGKYYDEQHVRYTLSTDGSNTATVAGYDTSYVNDTNFPADEVEAGKGWEITIPAKVSVDGKQYEVTTVGDDVLSDINLYR